jgi:hypothetical protein
MANLYSRREFLQLGALLLPGLAVPKVTQASGFKLDWLDEEMVGRVSINSVSVHKLPWDESVILYQRFRDEIINLYQKVESTYGPEYNPVWYRVWRGYVHSARVQMVKTRLEPGVPWAAREWAVGRDHRAGHFAGAVQRDQRFMARIYPLYYESTHWITDIVEGPDLNPWYQITEAWSKEKYYVPAEHVRLVPAGGDGTHLARRAGAQEAHRNIHRPPDPDGL